MTVIVVPHMKDMTPHQKEVRDHSWERYLASLGCYADEETGNRPCDNGVLCDKCQREGFSDVGYINFCVQNGIAITQKEADHYLRH